MLGIPIPEEIRVSLRKSKYVRQRVRLDINTGSLRWLSKGLRGVLLRERPNFRKTEESFCIRLRFPCEPR
jgi:hypothetical protein